MRRKAIYFWDVFIDVSVMCNTCDIITVLMPQLDNYKGLNTLGKKSYWKEVRVNL